MRYISEKILRLRFALVEEQLPPAIVLLESAALSTTLRMTHYFSWVFNLQILIYRVVCIGNVTVFYQDFCFAKSKELLRFATAP